MRKMYSILSNSPLFKGLSEIEISDSLSKINYKIRTFEADQLVASRSEPVGNLMILIEGSVRGEMLDYSGKILKVEDIHAPKPIAGAFVFGSNSTFPVDVITSEETSIIYISKDSVMKLCQVSPVFLKNFLNAVSNRAQFLSQRIWFLSFKTIKGKLAQYLLNNVNDNTSKVELKLSQKELAEFFGVTRPSLARALGEMEKSGIIDINKKTITLVNKPTLIDLLN